MNNILRNYNKMKKLFTLFSLFAVVFMAKAQIPTLTVKDFVVTPGEKEATIEIVSDMELTDYVAFQFDLVLPSVVTPIEPYNVKAGKVNVTITAYNSDIIDDHNLVASLVGENVKAPGTSTYRILCYSTSAAPFLEFSEESPNVVMTVTVNVAADASPGKYSAYIDDENESKSAAWALKLDKGDSYVNPDVVDGFCCVNETITYELKADYGTLILPFAADLPDGLKAYSCAKVEGNVLTLVEAESLAANTPYIMGGAKGSYAFTGAPIPSDATLTAGLLTGVLEDTDAPAGSYVLQNNTNGLGFYKVGSVIPTVKAYRCYLTYAGEASALMYRFGGTTNISNIEAEGNNAMYDILGRKVVGPAQKGVYILNGKKVFVK